MKAKIQCNLVRFEEFPNLLFGESSANQLLYFHATDYIRKRGNPEIHSIADFQINFRYWISAAKQVYGIKHEELFIEETTGEILIDESLALPFLAYIHPEFGIYIMECVSNMLQNGVVCSDTWLLQMVRRRFTTEELMSNLKG